MGSKAKRKGLPKTVRFEVLKRDRFACQYCGGKAPDVLLRVDHIHPVAAGGTNDLLNLITSCEPCNAGKSDRLLSDDAAVSAARRQAEELQARREQIEMMAQWQASLVDLDAEQLNATHGVIQRLMPGRVLSDRTLNELRSYLKKYGMEAVLSQFRASFGSVGGGASQSAESIDDAIEHALRALKWKAHNERDPLGSQARYLRAIARNRLRWVPERGALELLENALHMGLGFEDLKATIIGSKNWSSVEYAVEQMLKETFS